ncbi:cytochrome c biogenesis protein CcsA [Planctomicrobium sp. SH668]|uniref:cytochrome c biogenesis protein CcsA n=1 Tax=Planctomicrobium sp. SH668 TaxID=3448126 RepID=UPI003F5C082B
MDKVTLLCFLASYSVALALECTQFLRRSLALRWGTILFTSAGLVAQTTYLVARSRQHDLPPLLGSTHDWMLVSAWLAVVLYLGIQVWNQNLSLGVFALPVVLCLVIASHFVTATPNPRLAGVGNWAMIHASFLVFGMLGVLLSLLVSIMYLIQHHRLKSKNVEIPALHLFSLERLSRMNWWLVVMAVPCLTLGMLTGLWMIYLTKMGDHPVDLFSISIAANAAVWAAMAVLFGWLVSSRRRTGRIVAWRTLLACLFMLITMLMMEFTATDAIHGVNPVSSEQQGATA